ncbi:MAG: hypothetical protein WAZ75_02680 [Candidatus Absconditicoccaceae bacterium]
MKKFYFTEKNIINVIKQLMFKITTQEMPSLEITTLSGNIQLPGGAYIGCRKSTVLLLSHTISDFKLVIRRDDRKGESYEYPLDDITIQWIKEHKIPIHNRI